MDANESLISLLRTLAVVVVGLHLSQDMVCVNERGLVREKREVSLGQVSKLFKYLNVLIVRANVDRVIAGARRQSGAIAGVRVGARRYRKAILAWEKNAFFLFKAVFILTNRESN